jgi:hypothetical protein
MVTPVLFGTGSAPGDACIDAAPKIAKTGMALYPWRAVLSLPLAELGPDADLENERRETSE